MCIDMSQTLITDPDIGSCERASWPIQLGEYYTSLGLHQRLHEAVNTPFLHARLSGCPRVA